MLSARQPPTLSDLRKVVLADVAQGIKKSGERLLQSVPLGLYSLFHPGKLRLREPLTGEMLKLLEGDEVCDLISDAHR